MYCRKCGHEIPDDSNVCPYCGVSTVPTDEINNYPYERPKNTIAIAGFITSFFFPILGWIFGIMGLKRASQGYGGRKLAIAAIVIATLTFLANIYILSTTDIDELLNAIQ